MYTYQYIYIYICRPQSGSPAPDILNWEVTCGKIVGMFRNTGVCDKKLLQKIVYTGISAVRAPNQRLESSSCCRSAGQGLTQKIRTLVYQSSE